MKNIRCYFFITIWLCTALFMVSAANITNNAALNKAVFVSNEITGYAAGNAVDGSSGTGWGVSAGTDPEWIFVDLEESTYINDIMVEWFTTATSSYASKKFRVSYSDTAVDGDWQVIEEVDNNTAAIKMISLNAYARYVKLECLEPGTGMPYYGLAELQVLQYSASLVGAKGFSTGQADYVTLALDSTGTPYVAYKDCTYENQRYKVYVKKFTGGTWCTIGEFTEYDVYGLDFIIHNDIPYLTYRYYNFTKPVNVRWKCMTVKKYTSGAWESCDGNILDFKTEHRTSLAVNPATGVLTLAYITDHLAGWSDWYKPRLLTYDDGSNVWIEDKITMPDNYWCSSIDLAFSNSGKPYVGLGLAQTGSYKNRATVMEKDGGVWKTVGFPMFSVNRINYPSVAVDTAGMPYMAHQDFGATHKASVWYLHDDPAAPGMLKRYFKPLNELGISKRFVTFTNLICDNDTLYLGYCDEANDGRITMHTLNTATGNWDVIGYPGGFSNGVVEWVSLAKHGDMLYTAYADWSIFGRISVSAYDLQ